MASSFDEQVEQGAEELRRKKRLEALKQTHKNQKLKGVKLKRTTRLEQIYNLQSPSEAPQEIEVEEEVPEEEEVATPAREPETPPEEDEDEETEEEDEEEPSDEENNEEENEEEQDEEEAEVDVPSVVGMSPSEATAALASAGLKAFSSPQPTPGVLEPEVVGQSPDTGAKVHKGQTIRLIVEVPEKDKEKEKEGDKEGKEGEDKGGDKGEGEGTGEAGDGAAGDGTGAAEGAGETAGEAAGEAAVEGGEVAAEVAADVEFPPALLLYPVLHPKKTFHLVTKILLGLVIILALFVGLLISLFSITSSYCNQQGISGFLTQTGSKVAAWTGLIPLDVCKSVAFSGGAAASLPSVPQPQEFGNDAAKRAELAKFDITVNKADCTDPSQVNCTSLDNTLESTIQEIIKVTQACDISLGGTGTTNKCQVVVTGGSEAGHSTANPTCSHSTGQKMDLTGASQALTNYIETNFTNVGNRLGSSGGVQYADPAVTSSFVLESTPSHWDISVGCIG